MYSVYGALILMKDNIILKEGFGVSTNTDIHTYILITNSNGHTF